MSFLKKNFIWFVLAAVLVGEGVFTYMLFGRQAEVQQTSEKLKGDVQRLVVLRNQTSNHEARLAALTARRQAIEDERGECALFPWARDQAIESLFDAPELKDFKPTPWTKFPADQLGLFRLAYQRVYDKQVAALSEVLEKTRSSRDSASFAGANEFTKQTVTLGDIYVEQKDFWIRKAVIETAAASGIKHVEQLVIQIPVRPAPKPGHPAPRPTNTSDVDILMRLQGTYRGFSAFLEAMAEHELGFRVKKVVRVHRQLVGDVAAAPSDSAAPAPAEKKTVTPPTQAVAAEVYFTLPDSNIAIHTITFPAASFPDKKRVTAWLAKRITRLKQALEMHTTATSARVETAGPEGEEAGEVIITDELMDGGRDYIFGSREDANEFLRKRSTLEVVRLKARLTLWERAQALLKAGERVSETNGIVINMRPEEHVTKKGSRYTFVVDRTAGVELDFGLLTFAPNVSGSVSHGKTE